MHQPDWSIPLARGEIRAIIRSVLRGLRPNPRQVPLEELTQRAILVVNWAAEVRFRQALLDLAEAGELVVSFDENGYLSFGPPQPEGEVTPSPFSVN